MSFLPQKNLLLRVTMVENLRITDMSVYLCCKFKVN